MVRCDFMPPVNRSECSPFEPIAADWAAAQAAAGVAERFPLNVPLRSIVVADAADRPVVGPVAVGGVCHAAVAPDVISATDPIEGVPASGTAYGGEFAGGVLMGVASYRRRRI